MEKFTRKINEFTNNKFDFMLKSAILDKTADFCVVDDLSDTSRGEGGFGSTGRK